MKNLIYSALFGVSVGCFCKPKFALYASVGMGATSFNQKYESGTGGSEKNSKVFFDGHISLLGIKYGTKMVSLPKLALVIRGLLISGRFTDFKNHKCNFSISGYFIVY